MKYVVGKKNEAHWEIDNQAIKVYSKPQIIFGKLKLEKEVILDEIDIIDIYFTSHPIGGYVAVFSYTHEIVFNIKTKTDDYIVFNILMGTNRDDLIKAIDFLIDQNINFSDQYDLISLIRNKEKRIWDGVEEIIKANKLPYSMHKV